MSYIMSHFINYMKKYKLWLFFCLPAIFLFFYLFINSSDYQTVIIAAAYFSFSFILAILFLNPLISAFPSVVWLKKINRHRQEIGVSSFIYAVVHVAGFVMKRGGLMETLPWLFHPIIFPGFISFLILLALTVTSNKLSKKNLGFSKWKKIHNFVYLAQGLLFIHMLLAGGVGKYFALAGFIPLLAFQYLRRRKRKLRKK